VLLEALESIQVPGAASDKKLIAELLRKDRIKRENRLGDLISERSDKKFESRLQRALQSLEAAPNSSHPDELIRSALDQALTTIESHAPVNESNLHELRIGFKRARYVAEIAGADPTAQKLVAEFKSVQDAIGEWHDWSVLTQSGEKELPHPARSPLVAALRTRARFKLVEALRQTTTSAARLRAMQAALQQKKPSVSVMPSQARVATQGS
jgi:CHAD domain-containing protein